LPSANEIARAILIAKTDGITMIAIRKRIALN
jgi:hypothetical protein